MEDFYHEIEVLTITTKKGNLIIPEKVQMIYIEKH